MATAPCNINNFVVLNHHEAGHYAGNMYPKNAKTGPTHGQLTEKGNELNTEDNE